MKRVGGKMMPQTEALRDKLVKRSPKQNQNKADQSFYVSNEFFLFQMYTGLSCFPTWIDLIRIQIPHCKAECLISNVLNVLVHPKTFHIVI